MMKFLTNVFILIASNILIVVFGVFADLYDWSRWGNVPSFKDSMEAAETVVKLITIPTIFILNGVMSVAAFVIKHRRVAMIIFALGVFIIGVLLGTSLSAS